MKFLQIFFVICFLSFIAFGAFGCIEEETEIPHFLKAVGENIITNNGSGENILLKGVNAGGLYVIEEWMCPVDCYTQFEMEDVLYERFGAEAEALLDIYMDNWWSEIDFENIKEMGFNTIRLPFTWRTLQNADYTYKDNAYERLDWFIKEAEERGLYVILDLHGAHGSQNGRHHSGDVSTGGNFYGSEANMSLTEELWVNIATHYKNNPTVGGYDLLNEPEGEPEGTMTRNTPQWDYYDRLYKAIRAVDNNHIIIMEAIWEAINLPSPTVYNWENILYEYHYYCWTDSDNYSAEKAFIDQKVLYNKLTDHKVPIYVGEFTFFNSPESWEYALNIFDREGWNWTMWSYKVMGDSSWGIYNCQYADKTVNPYTDSYEEIINKWSGLKTNDSFIVNQWLYDKITC